MHTRLTLTPTIGGTAAADNAALLAKVVTAVHDAGNRLLALYCSSSPVVISMSSGNTSRFCPELPPVRSSSPKPGASSATCAASLGGPAAPASSRRHPACTVPQSTHFQRSPDTPSRRLTKRLIQDAKDQGAVVLLSIGNAPTLANAAHHPSCPSASRLADNIFPFAR